MPISGATKRRRTSAARPAVDGEHLVCPPTRQVGAVGEEAGGFGVGARVVRGYDAGLVADGQRVDDTEPPAVLACDCRPVEIEAPAIVELGERKQLGGGAPAERGHGAD